MSRLTKLEWSVCPSRFLNLFSRSSRHLVRSGTRSSASSSRILRKPFAETAVSAKPQPCLLQEVSGLRRCRRHQTRGQSTTWEFERTNISRALSVM